MAPNINQSNLALEREIQLVLFWLKDKANNISSDLNLSLRERMVQKVIEISITPFAILFLKTANKKNSYTVQNLLWLDIGEAKLQVGTGIIRVHFRTFIKMLFKFMAHWSYSLAILFIGFFTKKTSLQMTLMYGIGKDNIFELNSGDSKFIRFCSNGPISEFIVGATVVCQSEVAGVNANFQQNTYVRDPLIEAVLRANMSISQRLRLIYEHLISFPKYLVLIFKDPIFSLIANEYPYINIGEALDRERYLRAVFLTTSDYTSQPMWLRVLKNTKSHVIWYAQNFKPITYLSDLLESAIPSAKWMRFDVHWVWTQSFARYLQSLGHLGEVRIVPPITWRLPEFSKPKAGVLTIGVFDTSPYSNQVALENGGEISNYNHPENLQMFIHGILTLKIVLEHKYEIDVNLRVKTKRGFKSLYDEAYFTWLDYLAKTSQINLEPWNSNIYKLISECNLTIVYPFSSPAYVSEYLKIPSIYFDPTGSILNHNFADSDGLVQFASDAESLLNLSEKILNSMDGNMMDNGLSGSN